VDRELLESFVVQWRKMKDALEGQQQRLKEASITGGAPSPERYESSIIQLIRQLDELLKDHGADPT
jgi:hypothetical protein